MAAQHSINVDFTNSGQVKMKEAYAFQINQFGQSEPAEVRQV